MANSSSTPTSLGSSSLSAQRRRPTRNTRITGVSPISRPPVLLSFVTTSPSPLLSTTSTKVITTDGGRCDDNNNHNNVVIMIGHVGQSRFKHIVELLPRAMTMKVKKGTATTTATTTNDTSVEQSNDRNTSVVVGNSVSITTTTAEMYYRMYADTMEYIFHLLGQDSKDRRVIIVHDFGLYVPRTWQMAISRILHEVIGTQYISYQPALSMVPLAFYPTPNNNAMLVVYVTLKEAHCIVFADQLVLDYTYQTCGYPINAQTIAVEEKVTNGTFSVTDVQTMQSMWIDNSIEDNCQNPTTSLIVAIVKTLEACPRQLRLAAIHSLVFAGSIVDTSFGLQIAKRLEALLKVVDNEDGSRSNKGRSLPDKEDAEVDVPEQQQQVQDKDGHQQQQQQEPKPQQQQQQWTYTPFNCKLLRPLADHIAVVQFFQHQIRPDLLPWIGASAWAKHWHEHDPDSKQFHWQSLTTPLIGTTNANLKPSLVVGE